jgi:purine-nucleoside phosphorylase
MSIHIEAKVGEIADIVLLPGDPLRAEYGANEFLDDPVCYNRVRGMLGFTGNWNGTRVSIQGSGMGMPSLSIYAHELMAEYGVKTVIRIGSCGSYQAHVKVRDIVIAMTASTDSAQNRLRFGGRDYAPCADHSLYSAACRIAEERGLTFHAGGIISGDTFYQDDPDGWKLFAEFGVLAVEMETNALYTIAAKHKARALTICTVSDSLVTGEALPAAERQTSFGDMIRLALDTAVS